MSRPQAVEQKGIYSPESGIPSSLRRRSVSQRISNMPPESDFRRSGASYVAGSRRENSRNGASFSSMIYAPHIDVRCHQHAHNVVERLIILPQIIERHARERSDDLLLPLNQSRVREVGHVIKLTEHYP